MSAAGERLAADEGENGTNWNVRQGQFVPLVRSIIAWRGRVELLRGAQVSALVSSFLVTARK